MIVLPWQQVGASSRSKSANGARVKKSNLLQNLDACEKLFTKYQELARSHGSSENIHVANHGLWNVRFLSHHLASNVARESMLDTMTSWIYASGIQRLIIRTRSYASL